MASTATAPFEIKDEQRPLTEIPISPPNEEETAEDPASGEQLTVFHSADNFNVKHPLMHKWTLWFTKPPSGRVSCLLLLRLWGWAGRTGAEPGRTGLCWAGLGWAGLG